MNILQSLDNQKNEILPKEHSEVPKRPGQISPGDIHKIEDGQITPVAAPSEVEQDISPGTPTRQNRSLTHLIKVP